MCFSSDYLQSLYKYYLINPLQQFHEFLYLMDLKNHNQQRLSDEGKSLTHHPPTTEKAGFPHHFHLERVCSNSGRAEVP